MPHKLLGFVVKTWSYVINCEPSFFESVGEKNKKLREGTSRQVFSKQAKAMAHGTLVKIATTFHIILHSFRLRNYCLMSIDL